MIIQESPANTIFFCSLNEPCGILWRAQKVLLFRLLNRSRCFKLCLFCEFRESSFNMTRGGWRYWGGAPKICILQNQHMTSSYRSDGFQLNNLMTCATQLYHVVYRYNKCSLSNYYTLVHPKNALENWITTVSQVCHSINHWRQ